VLRTSLSVAGDTEPNASESSGDPFPSDATGDYGNQREYVSRVLPAATARRKEIEEELKSAFSSYIETREIEVVVFERMPATDLAKLERFKATRAFSSLSSQPATWLGAHLRGTSKLTTSIPINLP
jgi:hypothetical protein